MSDRVRIRATTILSGHWGTLTRTDLDLRRRDGAWQPQSREVYDHGHAAAVLLHHTGRDEVILVRQFRLPAYLNGDGGFVLEACAGLLDGDDPQTCAQREALEETGIAVEGLHFAFNAIMSPGSLTETVHCFIGEYGDGARQHAGGGLAHEGEDIEVVELPFDKAFSMIASGEIIDAKTIMLLQHLALARRR